MPVPAPLEGGEAQPARRKSESARMIQVDILFAALVARVNVKDGMVPQQTWWSWGHGVVK